MKVIHGLEKVRRGFKYPIVTIGTFDGVHLGHREVISKTVERANRCDGTSIVLTFDPHPMKVLRPEAWLPSLTSLQHRLKLIGELGANICLIVRFNRKFSSTPPEEFVRDVLVKRLKVKELLLGYNYVFGRDRSGDIDLMRRLADRYGFRVTKVGPVRMDGRVISSTLVRSCIDRGKLRKAQKFLGRPFSILGTVVKGSKRGRLIGYPTANIDPHHEAIPPSGVYGVKVRLNNGLFFGILNIGTRPTFAVGHPLEPTIEVHIFDFDLKIYGKDLEIIFLKKLRDERRFETKEDLIEQIKIDEAKVRKELR